VEVIAHDRVGEDLHAAEVGDRPELLAQDLLATSSITRSPFTTRVMQW
jgi:hypothetical protein